MRAEKNSKIQCAVRLLSAIQPGDFALIKKLGYLIENIFDGTTAGQVKFYAILILHHFDRQFKQLVYDR